MLPGTLADLAYISDPNLDAEKFETYELAYLGYWLDGRLSIDYRLFREYLDDSIDYVKYPYPDMDETYRLLENIATSRMSVYEAQIQLKPDPSWLSSCKILLMRNTSNTRMVMFLNACNFFNSASIFKTAASS